MTYKRPLLIVLMLSLLALMMTMEARAEGVTTIQRQYACKTDRQFQKFLHRNEYTLVMSEIREGRKVETYVSDVLDTFMEIFVTKEEFHCLLTYGRKT